MLALRRRRPLPLQAQDSAARKRSAAWRVEDEEEDDMTRTLAALAASALLLSCAPAEPGAADLRPLADARPAGEAVDCIQTSRISHTKVRDSRTLDFHMRGGRIYRSTLPHDCPGLAFEESFTYRTSIGRLCSVDHITVNSGTGINGPSCALGEFQPVEIASR